MNDKTRKPHVTVSEPVADMPAGEAQPTVPAAPQADPDNIPADAVLSHSRITECVGPAACGIELAPWSGLDRWYCPKCGFTTFEKDEALGRKPSPAS